jgi:hypothetical protein
LFNQKTKTGNLPRVAGRALDRPPAGQAANAVGPEPDDPEDGIRATRRSALGAGRSAVGARLI